MKLRYALLIELDQDLDLLGTDDLEDVLYTNLDELGSRDAERALEDIVYEPAKVSIIDAVLVHDGVKNLRKVAQ